MNASTVVRTIISLALLALCITAGIRLMMSHQDARELSGLSTDNARLQQKLNDQFEENTKLKKELDSPSACVEESKQIEMCSKQCHDQGGRVRRYEVGGHRGLSCECDLTGGSR